MDGSASFSRRPSSDRPMRKGEIIRLILVRPHRGHFGALWAAIFRTRKGNTFLHLSHAYSYMGMMIVYHFLESVLVSDLLDDVYNVRSGSAVRHEYFLKGQHCNVGRNNVGSSLGESMIKNKIPAALVLLCACIFSVFTVYVQVRALGLDYLEEGNQIKRHLAVLHGVAGSHWQYRVLSEYLVEGCSFISHKFNMPHPIATAFISFRRTMG